MAKVISYNKLWKLLIDKNMTRQDLREISGISTASLAKMKKGENITTAVLMKICNALDCNISDIMETIDDEGSTQQ
ncbi:MAG: helix-turn-helix transcriptional regulator [Lachnospiraceae bacterium]|nr:helix-turn-helix transcriptional regulator [Clostridiales bacterium]MCC8082580.1 helix-turn-helix transcriptional regulator [Lachnospiraceae bacterium]MCD8195875.1 helix-turn-helix transcriptional regulator [Lachnospiraceae bacterium]